MSTARNPLDLRAQITTHTVLGGLMRHIGRANGIHARHLVERLAGDTAGAAGERLLREVITQLRLEGVHVCGRPETGYYLAATAEELTETCSFLFNRAMASLQQVAAMRRISLPDLRGQLHLPT